MPPGVYPLAPRSIDQLLADVGGGVSAPPSPAEAANANAPGGVASATLPGDVKPVTTKDGWGGVLDAFKAVGGETPAQYQSDADKILAQVGKANEPAIKGITANIAKRDQILSQPLPHPVIPQLQGMPRAPDQTPRDPKIVFQQSSTILAILGSLFTRKPLITAMNAASAAMKGYAEGDKAAADAAHNTWKDSLEAAVAQNKAETDQYDLLMRDTELSETERNAQLAGLAASNNDQNMLAALKSGEPNMAFSLLEGRQKSAESLTGMLVQAQQFEQQQAMERERMVETERHNQTAEALTAQRYGIGATPGQGPLDPQTAQMLADSFKKTGTLPPMGYGPQAAAARNQVYALAASGPGGVPDLADNKATYKAVSSALTNFTTYLNRVDTYQRTFLKNVQQVFKYAPKGVGPTKLPVVDAWIQGGRQATGDPDVVAFSNAITTAKNEYARIMSGANSNAQLQAGAMEKADGLMNNAMNIDQLQAAFNVMNQDVQNAQTSTSEQIDDLHQRLDAIGQPDENDVTGGGQFQEGDTVTQNGVTYKMTNGQMVAQP